MTSLLAENEQKPSILGNTKPRLYTPPRRKLTKYDLGCSYGYKVIRFAEVVLKEPLDPWERWLVIHAGELLDDGRPRFRQVLVLVARQNGKTHLLKVLALYWLFEEHWPLIVGMSTNLAYAMEAWKSAVDQVETLPKLFSQVPRNGIRFANGEQCLTTNGKARYKIAASNRRGGRSLSIDRLILDELREHADWSAWNASVHAMNARPNAQVFAISNQGDENAVVLDSLRSSALEFMRTGKGDPRLGLFEWSAKDGCDLEDPEAWAAGNPNMGRRIPTDVIAAAAYKAAKAGGDEERHFRIEVLCQRVRLLNPAIDMAAWTKCFLEGDMTALRNRVAVCLDVAPDSKHATLVAAAVQTDKKVRAEVVKAWDDMNQLRKDLVPLLAKVRPQAFGWFPAGPAAALTADLGLTATWPAGITVEPLRGESGAVCMGLAEQINANQIVHSNDPLLNAHIEAAERSHRGDAWVFSRKGEGHVDAAYALAGAVHLARTLPAPVGKPRLIIAE